MKTVVYKPTVIFFAALCILIFFNGCSKSSVVEAAKTSYLEQQFEDNFLYKNFRVYLATDNGTDLTPQYAGYTFVMFKNTYYDGPVTATKNSVVFNGTWSSNADYSKLVIALPSTPAEFIFMNREWKFTKKSLPVMEMAPWGSLEPKVLHLERF
jgi:hypothetical protein